MVPIAKFNIHLERQVKRIYIYIKVERDRERESYVEILWDVYIRIFCLSVWCGFW